MVNVWIDVETTGLNPHKNGIWQVAMSINDGVVPTPTMVWRIQPFPADEVMPEALAVNGVTIQDLATYMTPQEFYKEFVNTLGKYINKFDKKDKAFFYGFNAKFDEEMIRAFFSKIGDRYFGSWFFTPSIDVMALAAEHLKDIRKDMPNFKQGTVARFLGIDVDEAKLHDAEYDIELTQKIYREVKSQKTNTNISNQ